MFGEGGGGRSLGSYEDLVWFGVLLGCGCGWCLDARWDGKRMVFLEAGGRGDNEAGRGRKKEELMIMPF